MRRLLALALLVAAPHALHAADYRSHPQYPAFAKKLVEKHGYSRDEIDALFEGVTHQEKIIELITWPAESRAWHEYRPIFITDARIEAGRAFMREHAETLERAEHEFGVDREIIAAIIGVETFYGRISGSWRVLEALATLGFDYPPRASFFLSELEHFLLLVREEAIDPAAITGSYAGAMGGGQFIPSSYRAYAVDFDGDGKRDLWNSWPDVIGSVANYFARHNWRFRETIAVPAAVPQSVTPPLAEQGMKTMSAAALRAAGVVFTEGVSDDQDVRFVVLQQAEGADYWIGLHNFGVINRYNRSPLYAMAVMELAGTIRE